MKGDKFDFIEEVRKFNPYHGYHGYFSTAEGATSMTYKPGQGKQYDNAIAREKQRTGSGGSGSKAMKNPTGDWQTDRKKAWEGADYAVQFLDDNTQFGSVDLRSKKTDEHGNPWSEGAYGNMQIHARSGRGGKIYMIDQKGAEAATNAANKQINSRKITDKREQLILFEKEIEARSLRTIDQEYIKEADAMRRR